MPKYKRRKTGVKPKVAKSEAVAPRIPLVTRYFAMSHNADREVRGIGPCKRGVWVEVPQEVYISIKRSIAQGGDVGWKVTTRRIPLEDKG